MHIDWVHADVLDHDFGTDVFDLVVIAYLQVPAKERETVVRRCFDSLTEGGTLFVVAHDSTNLTEGTGGPQDASVLYTAEDVLSDLGSEHYEIERAERTPRTVTVGETDTLAYDAIIRLIRLE